MQRWGIACVAVGLILSAGCTARPVSGASPSTVSSSAATSIPRYASNIVGAPVARDAETTILTTSDSWDVVVAFFDERMRGWKRMAMSPQTYQVTNGISRPTANRGGNKGLVRWTELRTSTSVTVTDRDGTIEIMEYVPGGRDASTPRRAPGDVEREMQR